MTLDESIDGLQLVESDGIQFYLDPLLIKFLEGRGNINIDFVTVGERSGYTITVGNGGGCATEGCSGC
jgi:Fe-S cluster assembly iron-binding protein IscA